MIGCPVSGTKQRFWASPFEPFRFHHWYVLLVGPLEGLVQVGLAPPRSRRAVAVHNVLGVKDDRELGVQRAAEVAQVGGQAGAKLLLYVHQVCRREGKGDVLVAQTSQGRMNAGSRASVSI